MPIARCMWLLISLWVAAFCSIAAEEYPERIVRIDWGLRSSRTQTWDGAVRVSAGEVIAIPHQIYSHSEFDIYNTRVSKTSWKMQTNSRKGGLYLKLRCPSDAMVTVGAAEYPFSFSLRDMNKEGPLQFQNGNISVREQTGTYLFVRAGRETGIMGEGTASIEPNFARMNALGVWTLRFVVGESGIPVGGGVRLSLHHSRGWGVPQYADPSKENYVTVKCSNPSAKLEYASTGAECVMPWPYPKQLALVRVLERPLAPGDVITIILGDGSGGSPGFRAAQTNESDADFRVEVCTEIPGNYFPIYRVIEKCPVVAIIPDPAVKAFLVAPSIVAPSESFDVAVRMEDAARNIASGYEGSLDLYLNGRRIREDVGFTSRDMGIVTIRNFSLDRPGIY